VAQGFRAAVWDRARIVTTNGAAMCQFSKVNEQRAVEVLHKICSDFLAFGQAQSDYSETELAEGVCMELLVQDMRITIEIGPEVTAEIETAKAIQKAAHVN
jgi:hypothetical protein